MPNGRRVRVLHLTENLRLADHERVEARRHAEEMPRGLEIDEIVEVRQQRRLFDAVKLRDEAPELASRGLNVVADSVDFGPVARRDDGCFAGRAAFGERAQSRP